jgi:hypothetical protein
MTGLSIIDTNGNSCEKQQQKDIIKQLNNSNIETADKKKMAIKKQSK